MPDAPQERYGGSYFESGPPFSICLSAAPLFLRIHLSVERRAEFGCSYVLRLAVLLRLTFNVCVFSLASTSLALWPLASSSLAVCVFFRG